MSDESPIFPIADGGTYIDALGNERPTQIFVSFRFEAVENPTRSAAIGRPAFDRALFVRTHYPGDKSYLDREVLRFVDGAYAPVIREPMFWPRVRQKAEEWMSNQAQAEAGTPLAVLNLNVAEIATLKAAGVGSVEMLAAMPDGALRSFEGARALREKAQKFQAATDGHSPVAKAEADAKAAREEAAALRAELDEMRAAVAAMRAERTDEVPRRRGRASKEAA